MVKREVSRQQKQARKTSRMPENSTFYEKIVPALLIVMAFVTVGLILFAIGVLTGFVTF